MPSKTEKYQDRSHEQKIFLEQLKIEKKQHFQHPYLGTGFFFRNIKR